MVPGELLKKGVTGFCFLGETLPVTPPEAIAQVYRACSIARGVRVVSRQDPHPSSNYYLFELEVWEEKRFLLLNSVYPILGCSLTREWGNLQFVAMPALPAAELQGFLVPPLELLLQPWTEPDVEALSSIEMDQVLYWESVTLGEIVFNHYD